ncbi:SepA family multidrug efflux transporter, partial [Staphylococcus aureus]|nr:SepA family multidrug efflux transporter [Staphylococcus aureus]
ATTLFYVIIHLNYVYINIDFLVIMFIICFLYVCKLQFYHESKNLNNRK